MNWLQRLMRKTPARPTKPPEALSAGKITTGYRFYWMKAALRWDEKRRAQVARELEKTVATSEFEANALERRFVVEGLDDSAHSGASLLALHAVLTALDDLEDEPPAL